MELSATWADLASAAFTGGVFVKLLDFLLAVYRGRYEEKKTARNILDKHLDPILKAADELSAKIRSLAEEDFQEFRNLQDEITSSLDIEIGSASTMYLIAQFWARVEVLRKESVYVQLAADKRGKVLLTFLRTLESKKVRLVDRSRQRGIGESLVRERENGTYICIGFYLFMHSYLHNPALQAWFRPVRAALSTMNRTSVRQRFLQYGIVVHALIDSLDPHHQTTRDRPSYPNKLSTKTRNHLVYRVFPVYLRTVKKPEKYVGG